MLVFIFYFPTAYVYFENNLVHLANKSEIFGDEYIRVVSSAKHIMSRYVQLWMSFIQIKYGSLGNPIIYWLWRWEYIVNFHGPRMDPWGTQQFIGYGEESVLWTSTIVLFVLYSLGTERLLLPPQMTRICEIILSGREIDWHRRADLIATFNIFIWIGNLFVIVCN